MVGRRVGRFLVLSKLGQGGMATVWKARDELLGREVALKVLDEKLGDSPKVRRRFLHEAQTVASLDHPGAVAVYDSGEAESCVYIAMRLVDGETLSDLLGRRLLPIAEAVRIVVAVADVLAHAHQRGVVHRDVTSRNIMVGHDGRVFVLDFGLALANWESRVTSTGTTLGTVPYMAPEVLLGKGADRRTDLYGLGVVLYEALTGAYPHRGDPPAATVFAALHSEPIPPRECRPEIPEGLERIVLKAIAREPEARYQRSEELIAALQDAKRSLEASPRASEDLRARVDETAETAVWPAPAGRPNPLYLAVLPFTVSDAGADPEGIARGFADRLAGTFEAALASTGGARVVSGASAAADPRDLARELGANALLGGSVTASPPRMRVAWSVHDPWRGVVVAGGIVEGTTLQAFDLEDQLVASVARELHLTLAASAAPAQSRPPDPAAPERYRKALAYLKRWDNEASLDGAIRLLEELVEADPADARSHATWARVLLYKSWLTHARSLKVQAESLCARAVDLAPQSPDSWLALGEVHLSNGRVDEARNAFETTLILRPQDLDARLGLATALGRGGLADSAERCLREALAAHADDWRVFHGLAIHAFENGRFAEAAESWSAALRLVPDNPGALRNLGTALYHMDRIEEAMEKYQASIALQPTPMAYSNLGTALFYLGRFAEAASAHRKAVELNPLDATTWGNLGNALRWIPGNQSEMDRALDRAIAIARDHLERESTDAAMWARLAGWLANQGRETEALAAIGRALKLAPESARCLVRAGHVYFQMHDPERALDMLEQAVRRGYGVRELERSREFASLRSHPRFAKMLKRGAAA